MGRQPFQEVSLESSENSVLKYCKKQLILQSDVELGIPLIFLQHLYRTRINTAAINMAPVTALKIAKVRIDNIFG